MALGGTLLWKRTGQVGDSASSPPHEDAPAMTKATERRDLNTPTIFQSRIPIMPVAATIFLLGFTGAALYGIRTGRRAELKEAAELAAKNHAASRHAATATPSALSRTQPAASQSSTYLPSSSSSFDWGTTGSSAPSALSRRGAGAASSPRTGFAASSASAAGGKGSFTFEEPPALTAIKAFTIATALVGVTSVAVVEVARRVWKVEDMYDLTDRLYDMAPKSFALFERVGNLMRSHLEGIFPEPADKEDPFASPVEFPSVSPTHEAASHLAAPDSLRPAATNTVKHVDDLFEEIEQAPTMRAKLELVELQLRGEKAFEDQHREELRRQRELRGNAPAHHRVP